MASCFAQNLHRRISERLTPLLRSILRLLPRLVRGSVVHSSGQFLHVSPPSLYVIWIASRASASSSASLQTRHARWPAHPLRLRWSTGENSGTPRRNPAGHLNQWPEAVVETTPTSTMVAPALVGRISAASNLQAGQPRASFTCR